MTSRTTRPNGRTTCINSRSASFTDRCDDRSSNANVSFTESHPMTRSSKNGDALSRREFIQRGAATAAVVAAPLIIPARLLGADAPSNRVRVGHIGAGRIAQGHDMPGVAGADLADVLAVCDLDSRRAASGKRRVERLYASRSAPGPQIDVYTNYRELLARSDIDAVTISLPDHQHAEV